MESSCILPQIFFSSTIIAIRQLLLSRRFDLRLRSDIRLNSNSCLRQHLTATKTSKFVLSVFALDSSFAHFTQYSANLSKVVSISFLKASNNSLIGKKTTSQATVSEMASTSALSANHSKVDKITTKPAKTTAMAGTLPFKVSKSSVTDKQVTTKQTRARASKFESIFGPSKNGSEIEITHGATKTDGTNSNQIVEPTSSNERMSALELAKYVLKVAEEIRLQENLSRFNLQQGSLGSQPRAIVKPSKATTQAFDIIADFNLNANLRRPSRAASLFLKLLHTDIRYQIYDHLADSELEVIINPTKKYHSPLSALKATCTTTCDEINKWAKRKDIILTPNPTFGLLNLSLTTFRFSWSRISPGWRSIPADNLRQIEKYQRCYCPRAAEEYLPHLELWQRATTLAKTSNAGAINHEICTNEKLANVGPAINRDRGDPHSIRYLMLNNHDNSSSPAKFDFQAKDYIVFNPNQIESEKTVPIANMWMYFQAPYVWSKDWDNHIEAQEYCFVHPDFLPDKWVRGMEACGTDTIRNGWSWSETFRPVYVPPQEDTEDEITETDDDDDDDDDDSDNYAKAVHIRGGEMMELDDEDNTMDLVSEPDETDPDLDMDREEEDDMEIERLDDTDNSQDDSMDTDSPNPPTQQQQLQATTDVIREAIARRVVNRSVSMKDDD